MYSDLNDNREEIPSSCWEPDFIDFNEEKNSFNFDETQFPYSQKFPTNLKKNEKVNPFENKTKTVDNDKSTKESEILIQPIININLIEKYTNKKRNNTNLFKTEIVKEKNPNKGRIRYLDRNKYYGNNDKFSNNNILIKIKSYISNNLVDFMNTLYFMEHPTKNLKLVYPINRNIIKNIYKNENIKWFKMKVKDYLSQKRTGRFKTEPYQNKKNIQNLYEKDNNEELIEILEMEIKDIYKIYISEEKEPRFEKFKNLKDDKDRIEQKMKSKGEKEEKIKEYLEKFEEIAKNLEKIFKDKKTRNNKNKSIVKNEQNILSDLESNTDYDLFFGKQILDYNSFFYE